MTRKSDRTGGLRPFFESSVEELARMGQHRPHVNLTGISDTVRAIHHGLHNHGHHLSHHVKTGMVGVALLVALSPIAIPGLLGIGRDAQQAMGDWCVSWVDEAGNVRGMLPSGPYGMALEVYNEDRELYFDIIRLWSNDAFARDPQGYDDPERYFEDVYLPEHKIFDPHSPIAQLLNQVPLYEDAHYKLSGWIQDQFQLQTYDAESMAHAAIASTIMIGQALAGVIASRNHSGKRKKGRHHHDQSDHQPDALDAALDTMSPDERRSLVQTLNDPAQLLSALAGGFPRMAGTVLSAVAWLGIAAAMSPSVGMGVVWYAELLNQPDIALRAAQLSGMVGHAVDASLTGSLMGALTHAATCVAPAVIPTAIERTSGWVSRHLTAKNRSGGEHEL